MMPNTKPMPAGGDTRLTQRFAVQYDYPVIYTRSCLKADNRQLAALISNHKNGPLILPVVDSGVLAQRPTLPTEITEYFAAYSLPTLPLITVAGGEACKNDDDTIQKIYQAVLDFKIDRHSYILAIGGGAVIDAVGYAAATAHRGIRLIRMPTTVLAQNDAAVGVKNAVNYQQRKNFLGTFVPPHAVISDFDFLDTLLDRDKRAGIAEAIKVALIKDAVFFETLYTNRKRLAQFEASAMEQMIIHGAQWHLDHIAHHGDPFEMGSSRPLDFGHWAAHKLEELSSHDLRHGEAVAIGIAIDSIYSHRVGRLEKASLMKILELLKCLGFRLNHPAVKQLRVEDALNEFREHLGGQLCITLLNALGDGEEVNDIDIADMRASIDSLPSANK